MVDRVASIILAGGQGTRLFPLTQARCKPAVSFGGRYRLIDIPLSNSLHSRINRIFIISQYMAVTVHHHVLETYQVAIMKTGTIELLSPEEVEGKKAWFNGTADAVRKNLDHILKAPVDFFLILSGDQLYNMDFVDMLECAKQADADLLIASIPVKESEAKRMGLLKIDGSNHVTDFYEKPSDPKMLKNFEVTDAFLKNHKLSAKETRYLGSMGIYVFKREALIALLKEQGDDFGKDLLPLQIKKGKTSAFIYDGYWEDIGTVESYYHANLALTDHKNCLDLYDEKNTIYTCPYNLPSPLIKNTLIQHSIISQGSVIEGAEISKSVIGIRTHIKSGTVVRDSIIIGNHYYKPPPYQSPPLPAHFHIGKDCVIQKAIIDEESLIGNNVQLINKNHLQKYDGDGIYIRDGIIIVTSGTELPDGFIL